MLKRFYVHVHVEARSVEGKPYSRSIVKAILFQAGQILIGSLQRKQFSIIQDKVFKPANEALARSITEFKILCERD